MPESLIFFLGAGASAAFGYPTTGPFAQKLTNQIPNSTREGVLLQSIRSVPGVDDAEQVLEILDSIVELKNKPVRRYFENSSLSISGFGNILYREFEPLALSLRDRIRTEIFRTYSWQRGAGRGWGLYRDLFFSQLPPRMSSVLEVFTTNYDRAVEEFCATLRNVQLIDGFAHDEKRRVWEWDPSILDTPLTDPRRESTLALYKLHGSLDWRKTIDGRIEQVRPEEPIGPGGARSFEENVLIYPGGKAQPISEPFRKLYEVFALRIGAVTRCLVIGFSFRDEYLNVGFTEFLERKNTTLIVISPSATKNVQANLLKGRSVQLLRDKGKLITIDKSFEEAIKSELPILRALPKKR